MTLVCELTVAVHGRSGVHRWTGRPEALALDATSGSPWVLVPPEVRRAFDAVAGAGVPLAETVFGPPLLGVKCGCNDAFLVTRAADDDPVSAIARIRAAGRGADAVRQGLVERPLLRPVVRGETLAAWGVPRVEQPGPSSGGLRRVSRSTEGIIWTHEDGAGDGSLPLASLPPHAAAWLAPWRHRLAARSDTRGRGPWWGLFRTEGANVGRARVVWADLGQVPRAAVFGPGDRSVPLNSCYVLCAADETDVHALSSLLNSPVAAAWLNAFAEPARGNFRRYLGWTVALLPLPRGWSRVRHVLAAVSQRAVAGEPPSAAALTALVAGVYGLCVPELEPLLAWGRSAGSPK